MAPKESNYTAFSAYTARQIAKSQIPLRYLVRTNSEPDSVMEFGREPAIARASSLLAS